MNGNEIVGLVAVSLTLLCLLVGLVYIGQYYIRKYDSHVWYRRKFFELDGEVRKLKERCENLETSRHGRHREDC